MYTPGSDSIIKTYNLYDTPSFTTYGILTSGPTGFASTLTFNQNNGTVTIL